MEKEMEFIPLPEVYEPGMADRLINWIIWGDKAESA